jgi:hypothetical protein
METHQPLSTCSEFIIYSDNTRQRGDSSVRRHDIVIPRKRRNL